MQFARPRPRRPSEPALPMINVVFLLLIFFLISAQIAPPPPFELTPPETGAEAARAESDEAVLYLGPEGALAFGAARDAEVWPALAEAAPDALLIRADGEVPARTLATLLARLREAGIADVTLATVPK